MPVLMQASRWKVLALGWLSARNRHKFAAVLGINLLIGADRERRKDCKASVTKFLLPHGA